MTKRKHTTEDNKDRGHAELASRIDQIIREVESLEGDLTEPLSGKLQKLGRISGEILRDRQKGLELKWKRIVSYSLIAFGLMLVGHFIFSYVPWGALVDQTSYLADQIDSTFCWMILAGFCAQFVDGALGMGYGLVSASFLLSFGINLTAMSGSIHTAEIFASGASGYSHYRFGNVDKKLFLRLVVPGVLGAVAGALALSYFGDTYAQYLRPILACYILFLGIKYILLAFRNTHILKEVKHVGRLAGVGGFLDSFGGGGWGPLVTSTLLRTSDKPRMIIGSVSLTEFFVTLASAFTFFTMIGISHWPVIIALIIGGLIASPIAARLAGKLNKRTSFILIGLLATVWSLRILFKAFF